MENINLPISKHNIYKTELINDNIRFSLFDQNDRNQVRQYQVDYERFLRNNDYDVPNLPNRGNLTNVWLGNLNRLFQLTTPDNFYFIIPRRTNNPARHFQETMIELTNMNLRIQFTLVNGQRFDRLNIAINADNYNIEPWLNDINRANDYDPVHFILITLQNPPPVQPVLDARNGATNCFLSIIKDNILPTLKGIMRTNFTRLINDLNNYPNIYTNEGRKYAHSQICKFKSDFGYIITDPIVQERIYEQLGTSTHIKIPVANCHASSFPKLDLNSKNLTFTYVDDYKPKENEFAIYYYYGNEHVATIIDNTHVYKFKNKYPYQHEDAIRSFNPASNLVKYLTRDLTNQELNKANEHVKYIIENTLGEYVNNFKSFPTQAYAYDVNKAYPSYINDPLYLSRGFSSINLNLFNSNNLEYLKYNGRVYLSDITIHDPLFHYLKPGWYITHEIQTLTDLKFITPYPTQYAINHSKIFTDFSFNFDDKLINNMAIGMLNPSKYKGPSKAHMLKIITNNINETHNIANALWYKNKLSHYNDKNEVYFYPNYENTTTPKSFKHIHDEIKSFLRCKIYRQLKNMNNVVGLTVDCIYTTTEQSIPTSLIPGQFKFDGIKDVSKKQNSITNKLSLPFPLTNEEFDKHQFVLIYGQGGTGKTTYVMDNYDTIRLFPTNMLTNTFNGITIQKYLGQAFEHTNEENPFKYTTPTIYLDEITMVDFDLLNKLYEHAKLTGKRLILSGDIEIVNDKVKSKQLQAINDSIDNHSEFFDNFHKIHLTEIFRAKDERLISLLNFIRTHNRLPQYIEDKNLQYVLDNFRQEDIALAYTNDTAQTINETLLNKFKDSNYIKIRAKFTGKLENIKVANNQILYIPKETFDYYTARYRELKDLITVDEHGEEIELNDKQKYKLNLKYKYMMPGYANTIHSFQGQTIKQVKLYICIDNIYSKPNLLYTAVSRVENIDQLVFFSTK